ncbi:MAG: FG-GAP repeat domain-containing protein [Spirochaetota bacterium]
MRLPGNRVKRVIALAAGTLGVVALAGCGGRLFPSFQPEARLDPPSGHYSDGIWVQTSGEPGERYYWSPDPRATIDEFEPLHDIYVAADTTFRYFAISSHGIRSPIIEAEYIIDDEGAPVVDPAALFRANITYYRFDLIWEVIPPWEADGIDDQDPSPFDAVTEWESLEYAVYSSAADDIGSLAEAEANGRLEMDWLTLEQNGGSPSYRYFASRPGEPRYFNVFVRDAEGNATAYGTRRFATRPALSVYIGTDDTGDDEVHLNDTEQSATPTFRLRSLTNPAAPTVKALDLARIDDDLFEDLAVVRSDGTNDFYRWYQALGDGTFVLAEEFHTEGQSPNPRQILIADMTGDGTPELVYNTGPRDIQVSSTTGGLVVAFAADAEGLTVGDIDNNGLNDIVSYGIPVGNENVRVWRNDGGGVFTEVLQPWSGTPGPGGRNPRDVQVADLDGDGNLDIIVAVASAGPPSVELAWGQGDGTFVEETHEALFWNVDRDTEGVAVADFDRDGDPDLFFANGNPTLSATDSSRVWLNNGDRTFSPGPDTGSTSGALGAIAADMNGDGWPDIVENHDDDADVQIWLNEDGSAINATPVVITPTNQANARVFAVGQIR